MKRLIILLLFLLHSFYINSQDLIYVNASVGGDLEYGEVVTIIGLEYFTTEYLSVGGSFLRADEINAGIFNVGYEIGGSPYDITPKIGIAYQGVDDPGIHAVIGLGNNFQISQNVFITANVTHIFNDNKYTAVTIGACINATQMTSVKSYRR